jgi:ankyrin repeat protein
MDLPPPPQDDDPIITQFKPQGNQRELNDDNIKRIGAETGRSILHNYCQFINTTPLPIFRYLIETKGCDLSLLDSYGEAPLHYAMSCFSLGDGGDINVMMYLFSQDGVDVNSANQNKTTLVHKACQNINFFSLEFFKLLIDTKGGDLNAIDDNNYAPISYAFTQFTPNYGGDINSLLYLLCHQSFDNIIDKYGSTLLHIACESINFLPLDVFKFLIESKGCDVNVPNQRNLTPLFNAIENFNPGDGGDIATLTYLLNQQGSNATTEDQSVNILFYIACLNINKLPLDVFKFLIETKHADFNALNHDNETQLYYAVRRFNPDDGGDIAVLAYLLGQKGVSFNTTNQFGETLFHLMCKNINKLPIDIFKLLIETKQCDYSVQDNTKNTPLHCALEYLKPGDDTTILTYLLHQKDVNFNISNQSGHNLLHVASTCPGGSPSIFFNFQVPPSQILEADPFWSRIVETIIERYTQQILQDTTL